MAESDALAKVPLDTLCLWVMLWPHCDDRGRHRADPRLILADVFPLRQDIGTEGVASHVETLARLSRVCLYTGCDGKRYLHVLGWEHQKIDNPSKSRIPPCRDHEPLSECIFHAADLSKCQSSRDSSETLATYPETLAHGPSTVDLGPRTVLTAPTGAVSLSPAGISLTLQRDEVEVSSTQSKPLAKKGETELVFEAWREAGHLNGRAKLTDDRQRKIRARFRDGYTLSDLIDAAEGIWESSWNVEHGQTGLELALRDAAHLERFRDIRRGLRSGREAARGDQMDEINALAESAYRKMQQERLGGLIE